VSEITYIKCGGSYQLVKTYSVQVAIYPPHDIATERLHLSVTGWLTVQSGYCWDGCSGVVDRKSNMRAGLGHDALYELMRKDLLPHHWWRSADHHFYVVLLQDGAWKITAKIDVAGLKVMRGKYAKPKHRKKRYTAP
jgi:hypothetical protein